MKNLEIDNIDKIICNNESSVKINAISFDNGNPDEKFYILLLNFYEDDVKDWSVKRGRQYTYDYLRFLISEEQIDPHTSFIIGCDDVINPTNKEDIKPTTLPITVFRFMKVMYENKGVLDDSIGFDIEEYSKCDNIGDSTIIEI